MSLLFVNGKVLPISIPCQSGKAPRWVCGRKPKRRDKGPTPVQTRPLPTLPSLSESNRFDTHTSRGQGPSGSSIRRILSSRRDCFIRASDLRGVITTVLACRERSENALIVLPTREECLRAAKEAEMNARGSKVIVSAGTGWGSWGHPAVNANSAQKSSIVIGTPRALVRTFCTNNHGRPWLGKVRFLAVCGVEDVRRIGAMKEMIQVLKLLQPKWKRKNVLILNEREGESESTPGIKEFRESYLGTFSEAILREKRDAVSWMLPVGDQARPITSNHGKEELISDHRADSKSNRCGSTDESLVEIDSNDVDVPNSTAEVTKIWYEVDHIWKRGCHGSLLRDLVKTIRAVLLEEGDRKILVFFPTARISECYATICRSIGLSVIDVHAKTNVATRQKGLEKFFKDEKAVLFATDTVLTTILPKINCIVQLGLPADAQKYHKRVSLLADCNKRAIMLGTPDEMGALVHAVREELDVAVEDIVVEDLDAADGHNSARLWVGAIDEKCLQRAYKSWFTFYSSWRRRIGWSRRELLRAANEWAEEIGDSVPAVEKRFAGKMRIMTYEEANIISSAEK